MGEKERCTRNQCAAWTIYGAQSAVHLTTALHGLPDGVLASRRWLEALMENRGDARRFTASLEGCLRDE